MQSCAHKRLVGARISDDSKPFARGGSPQSSQRAIRIKRNQTGASADSWAPPGLRQPRWRQRRRRLCKSSESCVVGGGGRTQLLRARRQLQRSGSRRELEPRRAPAPLSLLHLLRSLVVVGGGGGELNDVIAGARADVTSKASHPAHEIAHKSTTRLCCRRRRRRWLSKQSEAGAQCQCHWCAGRLASCPYAQAREVVSTC